MNILNRLRRAVARGHQRPASLPAPVKRPRLLETDKTAVSQFVLYLTGIVGCAPYPIDEVMLMCAAFAHHRPELVIDIGTQYGRSARIWHELRDWLGTRTQIHTIDLCDPSHQECPGEELGMMVRGLPVQQHIGDGFTCGQELLKANPGVETLLYLDGDHAYATVHRELGLAAQMQRGCVLVHDTFCQPGSAYNHGPYEAIHDRLPELRAEQVVAVQTGVPGMTYIGLKDAARA